MKKQKCAIYCRVSTPDQDISRQIDQLPSFAESQGWEVFDVFIDEGISGATISARPDFKRLLDDMIHKKFDILLVEFQDRITRTENLQERGLILQTIKDNNITLYSPSEGPCDLSDFSGEIVSTIKFIISAEERKRIKERTINGKKAKLEKGIPTALGGKLPIARIYHKESGKWTLDKEKAEHILNKDKAELVAFAKAFLANPDLVNKMKNDLPLNEPDFDTFYTPGEKGYTDYPFAENG